MTHVPDSPPTLAKLLELLSKLIELISVSFATPAPAPPPRPPVACSYCSSPRHLIRHCPRVLADIRSGLCKRNALGRVVLPSGLYVPHTVVGPNLRARLLAYTRTQQLLTPPVVRRPVPAVAPPPASSSLTPTSFTPSPTYRAPIISHDFIPGYAPPTRYIVGGLPDPSPRLPVSVVSSIPDPAPRIPISSTATDVPTAPEAPVHLQKATSIEASSTAPSPPVPPSDPLDDLFRELTLLHLHPDPLRLSALERRMAQLRDSS
ncbi:hypothetical protein R3P38DRAFT_3151924 [Favolaschia claudopus]|uniref:Uncharacterized protein n=1 Tax=Favolaschia claudopus TaxID=2862362 RepID=A0AAV9Z0T9_9AGAR